MPGPRSTVRIVLPAGLDPEAVDRALGVLIAIGAAGLDLEDEPEAQVITASLDDREPAAARAEVEAALFAAGVTAREIAASPAVAADWGSVWTDTLRPVKVGELWILPPGRRAPPGAARAIAIDPGPAFGSGFHPTTLMCLERLAVRPVHGPVLDVGTGSGVLAIAALALGAGNAVGIDSDTKALEVARENARRNGHASRLELTSEGLDAIGGQFDLVFANMDAASLIELGPKIVRRLGSGAEVVLSGVPADDTAELERAYRNLGLHLVGSDAREGWACLAYAASW